MEIIFDIQVAGRKYSVPLHPSHDNIRVRKIEMHTRPLLDYVNARFKDIPGTIFVLWNDDKNHPHDIFAYCTSPNDSLCLEVTKAMNEFTAEKGWSWEVL